MPITDNITAASLAALGPLVVGLTLIWTGGIKAVAPHTFRNHLSALGWIKNPFLEQSVVVAAALEVLWGLALLFSISTFVLYPLTIALLVVLSIMSWWGVHSGKATDCGCYGGFVQPSIYQSLAMNAIYVGLILMAWFVRGVSAELVEWKLVLAFAASLSTGIVSWLAMRFENQSGRLLFDTNPLKIGKRWRHKWTGGLTANLNGEFVVAFLGPDCPYCAQWVRLGNAVSQSSKLPQVVGVVAATKERTDAFKREHSIRFPLGTISQSLMGRLAQAVPTTVRVDQGVIRDQWVGSSPPAEFVDRLKDAFFPQSASKH